MKLIYSNNFHKRLSRRVRRNPAMKDLVIRRLQLLQSDWRHPSLRTHKLQGKRANEYAIWIEANLRITFLLDGDDLILTDILTHDEYNLTKRLW